MMNRKIYLMMASIVIMITAFVGCSDDIVSESGGSTGNTEDLGKMVTLTFTGDMGGGPKSRVVIDGGDASTAGNIDFLWEVGDVIYVNGVKSDPLIEGGLINPIKRTNNAGVKVSAAKTAAFVVTLEKAEKYEIDFRGDEKYDPNRVYVSGSEVNADHFATDYAIATAGADLKFTLKHKLTYLIVDLECDSHPDLEEFPDGAYFASFSMIISKDEHMGTSQMPVCHYESSVEQGFPIENREFKPLPKAMIYAQGISTPDYSFNDDYISQRIPLKKGKKLRMMMAFRPFNAADIYRTDPVKASTVNFLYLVSMRWETIFEEPNMMGMYQKSGKTNRYLPAVNIPITAELLQEGKVLYLHRYINSIAFVV